MNSNNIINIPQSTEISKLDETNIRQKQAFDLVKHTNQSFFLTGRAGTGKTTFLKNIQKLTDKQFIVVAPTGIAAIVAGGVTIHSFFGLDLNDVYLAKKRATTKKRKPMHKVSAGESMHSIAQEYGITLKALYKLNDLEYGTPAKVGMKLKLHK